MPVISGFEQHLADVTFCGFIALRSQNFLVENHLSMETDCCGGAKYAPGRWSYGRRRLMSYLLRALHPEGCQEITNQASLSFPGAK